MNIVIIEDEALSARELTQLLTAVDSYIRIGATLESSEQSVAWLSANPEPDVIFSDIQLSDGLSFDRFDKINIS